MKRTYYTRIPLIGVQSNSSSTKPIWNAKKKKCVHSFSKPCFSRHGGAGVRALQAQTVRAGSFWAMRDAVLTRLLFSASQIMSSVLYLLSHSVENYYVDRLCIFCLFCFSLLLLGSVSGKVCFGCRWRILRLQRWTVFNLCLLLNYTNLAVCPKWGKTRLSSKTITLS